MSTPAYVVEAEQNMRAAVTLWLEGDKAKSPVVDFLRALTQEQRDAVTLVLIGTLSALIKGVLVPTFSGDVDAIEWWSTYCAAATRTAWDEWPDGLPR